MGDKWREMKLGDFAPFLYGKGLSETSRNQSGNIPVFGSNGIIGKHDVAFVKKAGVIIGRKGTVGAVHFSKIPFWPIDTTFYVEESDSSDIRFIYYLLRSLGLEHMNADSAVPGLNRNAAHAIKLKIPPLPEQKAIASILGALDDKIELNRKMNETLEAMARAIFKSCFSYPFDGLKYLQAETPSPDLTGHPLPLGEGRGEGKLELVDSPLGKIPKGWRVLKASEAFEINPSRPIKKGLSYAYVDMASLPTTSARVTNIVIREFTGSGSKFKNGDVLFARITPCLENGKTALVDFLAEGEYGWGSTEFIVFGPKEPLNPWFIYCVARNQEFRDHAIRAMSGTSGRQRVDAGCFNNYIIIVPPAKTADKFGDIVRPWFNQMKANDEQSLTLASIRDALLPKLLSGEIRVKDAERFVEEAV